MNMLLRGGDTESSGFVAAYDLTTGKFDGLLLDASGKPLAINGLWALSPGNVSPNNYDAAAAPASEVYFTAGPNHGSGGLFGFDGADRRECAVVPQLGHMVSAVECVIRTAHSTRAATPKLENRLWMLQVELLAGFLPY